MRTRIKTFSEKIKMENECELEVEHFLKTDTTFYGMLRSRLKLPSTAVNIMGNPAESKGQSPMNLRLFAGRESKNDLIRVRNLYLAQERIYWWKGLGRFQ